MEEVTRQVWMAVGDRSAIAAFRREVEYVLAGWGEPDATIQRMRLIVAEMGNNLLQHATRGYLAMVPALAEAKFSLLAVDSGPGIADPVQAEVDGFSTDPQSAGIGLGALRRQSDAFEIFSTPGKGTLVCCDLPRSVSGTLEAAPLTVEGLNRPYRMEKVSGDQWRVKRHSGAIWILLTDGLGHGVRAYEASERAAEVFLASSFETPEEGLRLIHGALRSTRGAAAGLLRVDLLTRETEFCGVGNTQAYFLGAEGRLGHHLSRNGTLGHLVRKMDTSRLQWPANARLVMCSDGFSTRAAIGSCPQVMQRRPLILAGILLRDFAKAHDDCSMVVAEFF